MILKILRSSRLKLKKISDGQICAPVLKHLKLEKSIRFYRVLLGIYLNENTNYYKLLQMKLMNHMLAI